MTEKLRLGILFGGRSCEHEVSVTSARSVLEAVDKDKYDVTMIGIDKGGRWLLAEDAKPLLEAGVVDGKSLPSVLLDYPGSRHLIAGSGSADSVHADLGLDVIFPLLHGPYGEDGTVQGLLELAGIAYVGSGVVGSAVGMDKDMMKRAFHAEGLRQTAYVTVRRHRWRREPDTVMEELTDRLRFPMFVKPANLGSSVGVSKARDDVQLRAGLDEASAYDYKLVVEEAVVDCREIECSVLGNEEPEASVAGEIVPSNEFYDYAAKYIDNRSELIIPARLRPETATLVREMAVRAFRAVEAAGMARVDFLVRRDTEEVFLNEVNTIPGFTPISMYPKLWQASGIAYPQLIDRLIALALERQRDRASSRDVL